MNHKVLSIGLAGLSCALLALNCWQYHQKEEEDLTPYIALHLQESVVLSAAIREPDSQKREKLLVTKYVGTLARLKYAMKDPKFTETFKGLLQKEVEWSLLGLPRLREFEEGTYKEDADEYEKACNSLGIFSKQFPTAPLNERP
jgi:hypothetical protein